MATFRKSSSKTRSALESSTAIPPGPAEVISHVGEQAVQLTEAAQKGKAASPRPGRRVPTVAPARPETVREQIGGSMPPVERSEASIPIETAADLVAKALETTLHETDETALPPVEAGLPLTETLTSEMAEQAAPATAQAGEASHDITPPVLGHTAERIEASAMAAAAEAVADHAAERALFVQPPESVLTEPAQSVAFKDAAQASAVLTDLNVMLAELLRDYWVQSIDFFAEMAAVRSLPDVVTLNSRHFQRRMEVVSAQSRDLTALAGKFAAQTMSPFKANAFR